MHIAWMIQNEWRVFPLELCLASSQKGTELEQKLHLQGQWLAWIRGLKGSKLFPCATGCKTQAYGTIPVSAFVSEQSFFNLVLAIYSATQTWQFEVKWSILRTAVHGRQGKELCLGSSPVPKASLSLSCSLFCTGCHREEFRKCICMMQLCL